ncbi:unnamed protein product [Lymnaea stagnalis]|uniref:Uncharacterized protein n=1 Tax=Lymnaea stagnalis TaxID=6523 RepID=A0AAV2HSQ6_LYMST
MDDENFKFKYRGKTKEWKIIYRTDTSPESASNSLHSSKADANENLFVLDNSNGLKNEKEKNVGIPKGPASLGCLLSATSVPEKPFTEINSIERDIVEMLPERGINNSNEKLHRQIRQINTLNMNLNKESDHFISQDETASFIKSNIFQRDCKLIIEEETKDICQCGRSVKEHSKSVQMGVGAVKWDKEQHTIKKPCDSFGQIQFSGFGSSMTTPLYARICHKTERLVVWELMIQYWKMPPPRLLISVTGGAQKFELKPRLSSLLKQGLVGSAVNTGAWIITGGTKSGVMEFVGEAVKDHMTIHGSSTDDECVALGIVSWGAVGSKKALDGSGMQKNGFWPATYDNEELQEKRAHLDPNHTHFLLVDDGTEGKFGIEIEFRSALEKFISDIESDGIKIPVVLVVVEGGPGTMETVQKSLEKGTPAVIVKGSGRAADFLAYAYEEAMKSCYRNNKLTYTDDFDKKIEEQVKKAFEKAKEQISVVNIVKKCLEKHNLISVFDLEKSESVKDIDREILCALLKANKSDCKSQLNLALAWNRCDIARQQIFTSENRKKLKDQLGDLHEEMFTALVQDKTDFVQLFLDNGVDIKKFLKIKTLWKLYFECLESDVSEASILKNLTAYEEQSWLSYFTCQSYDDDKTKVSVLLQSINKVIIRLLDDESFDFYADKKYLVESEEQKGSENEASLNVKPCKYKESEVASGQIKSRKDLTFDFEYPERDLFIFAIFFNRRKMADLFLKLGVDQIGTSLLGCSLLKALSVKAESYEETALSNSFLVHSQILENFAISVLNECYMRSKLDAHTLLYRDMKQLGNIPILVLAERQQLMDFAEHPACQTKLTSIWKSDISPRTSQLMILLTSVLPFLIMFMKFNVPDHKSAKSNQVEAVGSTCLPSSKKPLKELSKFTKLKEVKVGCSGENRLNVFRALYKFYSAPVTKFTTNIMAYIILLGLFSYFLLTNIQPVGEPNSPSVIEYIVWAWFATMFLEEIRQVTSTHQRSITYKLSSWFDDFWNRFDLLTFICLVISIIMRYQLEMDKFVYTRVVYSITLVLTYLRFMQFYFAQPDMGPKVIMIRRMLTDLSFFFFILLVFVLGFGVAYHINMFPNQPLSWSILYTVFLYPYFQIYGELFLDELGGKIADGDGCTKNQTIWLEDPSQRCPEKNAIVYIFLAVYLVLTNILLINLLIAMFSYTFQKVQENSTKVWRFYRISLVYEYFDRPSLVPPIIIINLIWRMIRSFIPGLNVGTHVKFGVTLTHDANQRLRLFEKSAVDAHLAQSSVKERELLDFRVASTSDRLELVMSDLQKIKEAVQSGTQIELRQGIPDGPHDHNLQETDA